MTKQEWKLKYSAFRLLYSGLFNSEWPNDYINSPSFQLAVDAAHRFADELHWSIRYVNANKSYMPVHCDRNYYPIKKGVKVWQIRNNTKQ